MQLSTNFGGKRQCTICEAPARYIYFGALACPSCKMFFKRNAENKQRKMVCRCNGQCKINVWTRQACPSCRLAKCFRSGMRIEMLRASVQTTIRPQERTQLMNRSDHQIATLNLLQSDSSTLTSNEWMLLTNLAHSYDESKIFLHAQRLNSISDSSSVIHLPYQTLTQDFMTCLYETAGKYILSHPDFRELSFNERSVLLSNAANDVSCFSATYTLHRTRLLANNLFSQFSDLNYGQMTAYHHRRIMRFLDIHDALVKFMLSLLVFSMNGRAFVPRTSLNSINSLHILQIQNRYAEIIWKYLIYKYGFTGAVMEFMNMIKCLIATSDFLIHAQHVVLHNDDIESLVEQTEISLILDDVERLS